MEQWKTIDGYDYEISSYGRVKNKKTGKLINGSIHENKYLRVKLFRKGERRNFKVHRLVASAFIPNEHNKPQINHKDGNKLNNHVENLEWLELV